MAVTRSLGQRVRILWHDCYALAAEKPAGILVHSDGTGAPTLTDAVREALADDPFDDLPDIKDLRLQAVQRLDVQTSGIVLFSLTKEYQPAFDALVAGHGDGMRKRYFALVDKPLPKSLPTRKEVPGGWRIIDAPIARDRHNARRMRVGHTGKPARTYVRALRRRGRQILVEAELATGRKHQIRVHLAHVGCPIVGDALYGGTPSEAGLMLHAHELVFVHPVTGERVAVHSELPARFGWH